MARYLLTGILALTLLLSCSDSGLPKEISTLEKEVSASPTQENVATLLELYDTWLKENTDATPLRKSVLDRKYTLAAEQQRFASAISALRQIMIDYPADPGYADRLLQYGDLLNKAGKTIAAQVLFRSFVVNFPDHAQTAALANAYPGSVPIDTLMRNVASEVFRDSAILNESAARHYVDACEAYALSNQGKDASAEYLHKASETARTLRSTPQALDIYDWILKAYPQHRRSSQALFLKGFTYDNDLHDYDKARAVYQEFLQKYPNDEFASSAQFLLDNLGKSDDELLEALQKKAATQKSPGADSIQ